MIDKLNGCIFLIENDDLLEKYNTIWDKINTDIKKEFDSESVYNNFFLKNKIMSLMKNNFFFNTCFIAF